MKDCAIRLVTRWARGDFVLDVDLNVRSRVLGIVGPSGSGKSTLIGIAAGLLRPPRCELNFNGSVWVSSERQLMLKAHRRRVGLVPQEGLLFPHLDVRANLTAARHVATRCSPTEVEALASRLGIAETLDRSVHSLSGGQRQRVALGRALLSTPQWLLLDEPLGALDYARRRSLLPLLRSIVESSDVPLWFVSHDPAEVVALCDEVVVLERGRIVARGSSQLLRQGVLLNQGPQGRHENLLRGRLEQLDSDLAVIVVGTETRLLARSVPAVVGQQVFVSLFVDDVRVSLERPQAISARNVHRAQVKALPTVGSALLEVQLLGGPPLLVDLSQRTIDELALSAGMEIYVLFKASSCRVWANSS